MRQTDEKQFTLPLLPSIALIFILGTTLYLVFSLSVTLISNPHGNPIIAAVNVINDINQRIVKLILCRINPFGKSDRKCAPEPMTDTIKNDYTIMFGWSSIILINH
jgi:hypothetical protein